MIGPLRRDVLASCLYPHGIKVTKAEMDAISPKLTPHAIHGDWNYTLRSRTTRM